MRNKYNILAAERNKMKKQILHLQKQKEKRLPRREFLNDISMKLSAVSWISPFSMKEHKKNLILNITVLENEKLIFRFQNDVEIPYKK